jgi:hypothetical protein
MYRLDSLIPPDIAADRRDDVFSLEFPNRWDAQEARHAAELAAERPSIARRALAQGFAALSRGSAAAVRQLDDVVADDLGRALAPAK